MKKLLRLVFLLLLVMSQQVLAQMPTVSTSDNPIWYYIEVVGSDDLRKNLVFTRSGNEVYGASMYDGGDNATLANQLWRFEASESEYVIINKSTNRKLSLKKDTNKEIVAAILATTPATTWKITSNSGYYNIEAKTPLSSDPNSKYAHQMNTYGKRNLEIGFEIERWKSDKSSLFKFVLYEDPSPVISDENTTVWYYINSMKSEYKEKCMTDVTNEGLPFIKFALKDKASQNEYQQWKLVKKDQSSTDDNIYLINRATGNMIQTKTLYNEYYYTQSTAIPSENNGWKVNHLGKKQFEISGLHESEITRYLYATSTSAAIETYIEGHLYSTGYAWGFEKADEAQFPTEVSEDAVFLSSVATPASLIETIPSDIKFIPSSGSASSFQSGENIEKSYDGNPNTLYHSSYSSTKFPVTLTYNFTDVARLDYLIYHPRTSGGNNGKFKELEIWYTTKGSERKKLGDYDFEGRASASVVSFENPMMEPVNIEFIVKSGVGNFVSCAEMEFYCINPEKDNVYELFEDRLLTKLKPGITIEDINNSSNLYIRDMAMSLYKGQYSLDFRADEYKAYLSMNGFNKLTNITTYSKYENPTGIYFPKGKHLVMVDNIKTTPVSLIIPKYENQTPDNWSLPYQLFPLKNGVNIVDVGDWNGLGYINYYSDRPENEEPIKVHVVNGVVQGYFDVSKHTNEDWVRILAGADKYVIMDMLGAYSQIAFPVDSYRKYAPKKGVELVSAYDTIVKYEHRLFGYNKYNKNIKNHVLWRVNYSYYAYKDGDGCSFEYSYMNKFASPNFLSNMSDYESWTIPHELGHVHQFGFYNWHGMTEVTVNIPNIDIIHRMKVSTTRYPIKNYQDAYNKIIIPEIAHASYFGDNYNMLKLVPFAQLYHFYAEKGNYDFYPDLFEALRNTEGSTSGWTMADYEMNFVKKACDVTKLNLFPFFEKWGFFYYTNEDGRAPFEVEDYGGTIMYSLNKSKVDNFKSEIEAKGYPYPNEDICLVLPNGGRMKPHAGIEDVVNENYIVYSQDGYIIVVGAENYEIRNISGITVDRNSKLSKGIYLVIIEGKATKVLVK